MKNQIYQDQIYTGRSPMLYPEDLTALELKQCSCRHSWDVLDLSYSAEYPAYDKNNEGYYCKICGQSWKVKNVYLPDCRIKTSCATSKIWDFSEKIDTIYAFLQNTVINLDGGNFGCCDEFSDYISYAIQNIYRIKKGIDNMEYTLNDPISTKIVITDEIMDVLFIVEGYMFAAYNIIQYASTKDDFTSRFERNSIRTIMNTPTFILDLRDPKDLYRVKLMASLDFLARCNGENNSRVNNSTFIPFGIQVCEMRELQYLNMKRANYARGNREDEEENYEEEQE